MVHQLQRCDIHWWYHGVGLDLVGIEGIEAASTAEVYSAVAGLHTGIGLKLLADQSVMQGKPLGLLGFILHNAMVCGEPECAMILDNTLDVLTWYIKADTLKTVHRLVVLTKPTECASPYTSTFVDEGTIHLTIW